MGRFRCSPDARRLLLPAACIHLHIHIHTRTRALTDQAGYSCLSAETAPWCELDELRLRMLVECRLYDYSLVR